MMILNFNSKSFILICWKTPEVARWRCSLRKLFLNSLFILRKVSIPENDFLKVALATLLKSIFVTVNFLNIFQEFNKNCFHTKNTTDGLLLKLTCDADASVAGV